MSFADTLTLYLASDGPADGEVIRYMLRGHKGVGRLYSAVYSGVEKKWLTAGGSTLTNAGMVDRLQGALSVEVAAAWSPVREYTDPRNHDTDNDDTDEDEL